ncbi:MAG: riboflavin synthase subunit beta [Flavobacteriaceae bacterium]|nr:riboflavin synthase subunit beta [Flavobacteriaceae bacterium]
MGIFKLRKNKRYDHSGRFSEEKSYVGTHAKPRKIKSQFDEYRTTVGDSNSFKKKFRNAVEDYKKETDSSVKKRLIIILIILIALFLLAFIL